MIYLAPLIQLPVFPPLPQDAREKPDPQFILKSCNRIAPRQRTPDRKELMNARPRQIPRHAGDVRNFRKVERGAFRRLHVQTVVLIKNGASDAVPVNPASKMLL